MNINSSPSPPRRSQCRFYAHLLFFFSLFKYLRYLLVPSRTFAKKTPFAVRRSVTMRLTSVPFPKLLLWCRRRLTNSTVSFRFTDDCGVGRSLYFEVFRSASGEVYKKKMFQGVLFHHIQSLCLVRCATRGSSSSRIALRGSRRAKDQLVKDMKSVFVQTAY